MADDWSTKFERTWLSSVPACLALDEKLAGLISGHWRRRGPAAKPENVLPLRCKETAALLRDAGKSPSNAIHCTVLLALVGELLLCAEKGGIFRDETVYRFAGKDYERKVNAEVMRRLRNAVCHPAAVTPDDGEIALLALADYVELNLPEEKWGPRLRSEPSLLADRVVAFFALQLVDNLGWCQAEHWNVKLPGVRRPRRAPQSS
jgi:hypothetical protein